MTIVNDSAFLWLSAASFLAAAAFWDMRQRRIPNLLAIVAAVLGVALPLVTGQPQRLAPAAASAVVFAIAFGIPAWKGWLGFGDVKMIAVLALLLGWYATLNCLAFSFGLGAIATVAYLASKGRLREAWPKRRDAAVGAPRFAVPLAPYLFLGTVGYWLIVVR